MPGWMAKMFLALGVLLFVSLVALIGSAIREGSLPVGQQIDIDRRKLGRLAMGLAIVLASGAVALGNRWWGKVDTRFQQHRLYKPVIASAEAHDSTLALRAPGQGEQNDFTPLIPEHG